MPGPHRISGRNQGDFSPGQSLGRNRTVMAASGQEVHDTRSTSRSVLVRFGYIRLRPSAMRCVLQQMAQLRQIPGHW